MTKKSSPAIHGVGGSSSTQEHSQHSSPRRSWIKSRARSHVDMLINDYDIVSSDGSYSSEKLFSKMVDYEPVFIHQYNFGHTISSCQEIWQEYNLDQQHETTESRGRLDIITRLPSTLLCNVLSYLDPEDFAEASLVSNDWHLRLNDFATKWARIELSDDNDDVGATYDKLVSVSPYIRSLSVQFLNTDEPVDALIQGLARLNFANLRSLDLGCMVTSSEFIFDLLRRVKDTLTQLSLMCVAHDGLPLTGILSICTNLIHLRHSSPDLRTADPSSFFSDAPVASRLKSLQLVTHNITYNTLAAALQYVPRIQTLVLCECEPDAIDALNQYAGPQLEYLHINPNLEHTFPPWADVEYIPHDDGLNTVIANNMDIHSLAKLSNMLAERAQSSLKHLTITTTTTATAHVSHSNHPPWVKSAHFDSLRTLSWRGITQSLGPTVAEAIQQSTNLEEVVFEDCKVVDAAMLAAVLGLKRIQKLAIVQASKIDHEHLVCFLLAHSDLMHASPLKAFQLTGRSSVLVRAILDALSSVITLRQICLSVHDTDHLISVQDMDRFIRRLGSSASALQRLTLTSLDAVTDSGIQGLGMMDGLREVVLTDLTQITSQGVYRLVDECTSLQSVRIDRCPMVSYDALAHIEKKLMERATKVS